MKTVDLGGGHIEAPDGWEISVEAQLRAPEEKEQGGRLAARGGAVKSSPRPSLLIQRRPAPDDVDGFLGSFLRSTAAATRGMTAEEVEPLSFADGASGKAFAVHLETEPAVAQLHVVRVDAGVMTHLVLAVAAGQEAALGGLRELAQSYRPPGSSNLS